MSIETCSQDIKTVEDVKRQLGLFNGNVPVLGWNSDTGSYMEISEIDIHKVIKKEKYCVVISMESVD